MKVREPISLPVRALRPNPENPRRPMSARHDAALEASLERFGFAGVLAVYPIDAKTYAVLNGNSRLDKLINEGIENVPCIVLDDLSPEDRDAFVLSHDRITKLFDEEAVTRKLKALATEGADLLKLQAVTATEGLQRLVDEQSRSTNVGTRQTLGRTSPQKSLVLYGPAEDVDALKELVKRVKGRMGPVLKLRTALEQAEQYLDLTDEQFLLAFAASVKRVEELS